MADPFADERPWWAGQDDLDATCESVGLAGWCGEHCPVLHRGECRSEGGMLSELRSDAVAQFFAASGVGGGEPDHGCYGPVRIGR